MMSRTRRIGAVSVAVLAAVVIGATGVARAAGPMWMPGFPLRAGTAVIMMWSPMPGATAYKLMKKVGDGEFKEVYKGSANTFSDVDADATRTIEYKVVPVVAGKDGEPSTVATLKGVEPLKPPKFTGSLSAKGTITIRWSNVQGAMFYNLYRSEQRQGPFSLVGSFQQDTYTDTKVQKGKSYFYQVTAVDKNSAESVRSEVNEASLKEETQVASDVTEVIRKVTPKGQFLGEELYEFEQPRDMGNLSDGRIYVVDRNSVQFCDKDGKYLGRINLDRKWSPAGGALIGRDGNFILTFLAEQLVRRIDETGKPLQELTYPLVEGFVNSPNYVAVDGDGNYWITDGVRFQIIKMDPSGKVLEVLGRKRGTYDAKTRKENDFPGIGRIYYNSIDGKIYAVLGVDAAVKVIDPKTGKVVKTFGGVGPRPEQFQGIGGMAFRKNGNILILDHMMQVVKEFTKGYEYVASYADITDKKPARLSTNFASGFEYREDLNRFYVLSTMGNRVYVYDMPM